MPLSPLTGEDDMDEKYNLEKGGEPFLSEENTDGEIERKPMKNEGVFLVFGSCLRALLAIFSK